MKKSILARSVCVASAAALACGVLGGTAFADTPTPTPTPSTSSTPTPTPSPSSGQVAATTYRLQGSDRFETAVQISKQYYSDKKSELPRTVYIASGMDYPDALSVAPVAALDRGPLLLVWPNSIPQSVTDELKRLQPKRIVVVGGPGAVDANVFAKLELIRSDTKVIRVGGIDRYETSRKIIEYGISDALGKPLFSGKTALIATGADYPDALSAGGIGGLPDVKGPVLLENGLASSISAAGLITLAKVGALAGTTASPSASPSASATPTPSPTNSSTVSPSPTASPTPTTATSLPAVTVVGGEGVIKVPFFKSIPAGFKAERAWGQDRYLTSQALVNAFKKEAKANDSKQGVFATGLNFPDALAGAAYAGASASTLWVIPPTCVPAAVKVTAGKLKIDHFALLGGTGALTGAVDSLTVCP